MRQQGMSLRTEKTYIHRVILGFITLTKGGACPIYLVSILLERKALSIECWNVDNHKKVPVTPVAFFYS